MALMNKYHKALLAILSLLVVALPSTAVPAVDFTKSELEQLSQGKLVKRILPESGKNSTLGGSAYTLVNASPAVVWKASTDISAWPSIYPYTYSAEPVSRQSNATLVKVRVGVPLLKANIYMTMVADKASYEMTTTLNKQASSPLAKEMRSSMKLLPQAGGKTLIVYSCVTEVSFSPIMAVLGRGVIRDMENVLLRLPKLLKQYVEGPTGAKYR